MGNGSVRIVVADHRPMARAAFVALLNAAGGVAVVGEAGTGAEAIHVSLATHPDVVLVDIELPIADGVDVAEALRQGTPDDAPAPRVVIVTGGDSDDDWVYEALHAGACGFVAAQATPEELTAAVRAAAADDAPVGGGELVRLIGDFTPDEGDAELFGRWAALDGFERALVTAVSAGFSDREVAEHFDAPVELITERVAHAAAAVGASDRTQLTILAFRTGVALGPDPRRNA